MATWSTFRAQVRRELEESTAGVWSDTSLLWWANECAKDIAIKSKPLRKWEYTTTVSGTSTYNLPTGMLEVIEVFGGKDADDDRYKLARKKFSDVPNLDVDNGRPHYYIIDDDSIILYPAPDAAYELSILSYVLPTELASDSDAMPFGSRYDAALSYYIKSKAMEQVQDWDSADAYLGRYNAEMDKVMVQEGHEANAAYRSSVVSVY